MSELVYQKWQLISIDSIYTKDNVRKIFDNKDLESLSKSILLAGMIHPILVSEDSNGNYFVVAGERRLRAAKLIDLKKVPCVIVSGNEDKLKDLQIIENCHRKEMNPIEEMEAFLGMLSKGFTTINIADHIAMTEKYVQSRLSLVRLCNEAKIAVHDNKLNVSQCKYLVLMDYDLQNKALKNLTYETGSGEIVYSPSKAFYEFYRANKLTKISDAIFDLDCDKVNGLKCTTCHHNTTVNENLFNDITTESMCSNPECFKLKHSAHIESLVNEEKKKGFEVVEVVNYFTESERTIHHYRPVTEKDKKSEDFKIEKVVVVKDGKDSGKVVPVYTEDQLDLISNEIIVDVNKSNSADEKTKIAESRLIGMILSNICSDYLKRDEYIHSRLLIVSIYTTYMSLSNENKDVFISIIKEDNSITYNSNYTALFFDNIELIKIDLSKSFAIITLLNTESFKVSSINSIEFSIIKDLAIESDVSISDCIETVFTETGIRLKN